jgi:3-oxoacyl-[acyl-carrier protein] reductase
VIEPSIINGLKNKRVLITGATGGIGTSLVRMFAAKEAVVGIHYHFNQKQAELLEEEIELNGGRSGCFQVDLVSSDGVNLIDKFVERFDGIDILINNAGAIFGFDDFLELDEAAWVKTFRLNAQAPFFLAQRAFIQMKGSGGGKIINISSIAAKYGGSSQSMHYGSSKAALEAITYGLAKAGAPHNILVNAVRGGFIDTAAQHRLSLQKDLQERVKLIPLKRAGKPEDISSLVVFLASDAGDFITGEIMTVSGGD